MSLPDEGAPAGGQPVAAAAPRGAEPSGDERVEAARADLAGLDALPVHDHVAVYERVHQRLQEALADVDDRS